MVFAIESNRAESEDTGATMAASATGPSSDNSAVPIFTAYVIPSKCPSLRVLAPLY